MDARLQAGIELVLEKKAAADSGVGLLAGALNRKAAAAGLTKAAAEGQGVEQTRAAVNNTPSSSKGTKMEDKNKDYGKGTDYKLDDDPSKGSGATETGSTVNVMSGKNITTEGSGMPDLSLGKQASMNQKIMATMIRSQL